MLVNTRKKLLVGLGILVLLTVPFGVWTLYSVLSGPGSIQEQLIGQGYRMSHAETTPRTGTWPATTQNWRKDENASVPLFILTDDTPFSTGAGDMHVDTLVIGQLSCGLKPGSDNVAIADLLTDANNVAAEVNTLKPIDGTKLAGRYIDCIFIV